MIRLFGASLVGAASGCLAIVLVGAACGLASLIAYQPVHALIMTAGISAVMITCLWTVRRRTLPFGTVAAAAALLTIFIFAAPLVYLSYTSLPVSSGGPLFG